MSAEAIDPWSQGRVLSQDLVLPVRKPQHAFEVERLPQPMQCHLEHFGQRHELAGPLRPHQQQRPWPAPRLPAGHE